MAGYRGYSVGNRIRGRKGLQMRRREGRRSRSVQEGEGQITPMLFDTDSRHHITLYLLKLYIIHITGYSCSPWLPLRGLGCTPIDEDTIHLRQTYDSND